MYTCGAAVAAVSVLIVVIKIIKMVLYIIGLGLADEKDITVKYVDMHVTSCHVLVVVV